MIDVLRFFDFTWYIWASLALFGIVIFEWRGPKSGKSVIRFGISSSAALALTLAAFVVTGGVMISLAQTSRGVAKPETAVFQAVEEANALYIRLTQEAAGEDWGNVREVASSLSDELRFLGGRGSAAPMLAGMDNRGDIDETRELLKRAAELAEDIEDSSRDGEQSLTLEHLSDLDLTYGRLTAMVEGWPRVDSSE